MIDFRGRLCEFLENQKYIIFTYISTQLPAIIVNILF